MATATNSRIAAIAEGQFPSDVLRNAAPAKLYEEAVKFDDATITSTGGIATKSGEMTGRRPKDKRIVRQPNTENDIW